MNKNTNKKVLLAILLIATLMMYGYMRSRDIPAPSFSCVQGFFDEAIYLEMTGSGYEIRYTLDGSEPTKESTLYTGAILIEEEDANPKPIDLAARLDIVSDPEDYKGCLMGALPKASVIKAACFNRGGKRGDVATSTYLIGKRFKGQEFQDMPVVSIITDSDNLMDYNQGIYVLGEKFDIYKTTDEYINESVPNYFWDANYMQRGMEWERPVHITVFDNPEVISLDVDAGMRIKGASSRSHAQKSLNIFFREEYGGRYLENGLDGFCLSSGGGDDLYKLRDPLAYRLAENLDVDIVNMKPCQTFINGEYWGMYYLTEKQDEHYISEKYHVAEDNVLIYKNGELNSLKSEDIKTAEYVRDFPAENDMSDPENYLKYCEAVDIQSLADYYAYNMYINNTDWPKNNYAVWRVRISEAGDGYGDGRWRYMLFDCNVSGVFNDLDTEVDPFETRMDDTIEGLMRNPEFRQVFARSMLNIVNVYTVYDRKDEILKDILNKFPIQGLALSAKRYGIDTDFSHGLEDSFEYFFANRGEVIIDCLERYLNEMGDQVIATSLVVLCDNPEDGSVQVNGATIDLSVNSWMGYYFIGYPTVISAQTGEGCEFLGWEYTLDGESIIDMNPDVGVLIPANGLVMRAKF